MKIYSIEGNRQKLDGGAMFGHVPKALWNRWITPDSLNRIELSCRCLLLKIHNKNILFETGIGTFFEPRMAERFGVQNSEKHLLLEGLNQLGVKEEDIHMVILSHLHFDHAGGLLPSYKDIQRGKDSLLFSNATYITSKSAFERSKKPHIRDKASFIPDLHQKLEDSKRLLLIDQHRKFENENITFVESNGHTPGQIHALIHGKNQKILFCGDLIPGQWWLNLPVTMGYDRYPEKLIDEKKNLLDKADKEHWGLFFTHDPKYSMVQIKCDQKGKYTVVESFTKLDGYEI